MCVCMCVFQQRRWQHQSLLNSLFPYLIVKQISRVTQLHTILLDRVRAQHCALKFVYFAGDRNFHKKNLKKLKNWAPRYLSFSRKISPYRVIFTTGGYSAYTASSINRGLTDTNVAIRINFFVLKQQKRNFIIFIILINRWMQTRTSGDGTRSDSVCEGQWNLFENSQRQNFFLKF